MLLQSYCKMHCMSLQPLNAIEEFNGLWTRHVQYSSVTHPIGPGGHCAHLLVQTAESAQELGNKGKDFDWH